MYTDRNLSMHERIKTNFASPRFLHMNFILINKPSLLKRTRTLSPSPLYPTVLLMSAVREMKMEMIMTLS